jgi:hypothetical protein
VASIAQNSAREKTDDAGNSHKPCRIVFHKIV